MPSRRRHCLILLATTLAAAVVARAGPGFPANGIRHQEALAYARPDGALLYRESHWRYRRQGVAHRLVLYRCPGGDAFARKTVIERSARQAPDFDFLDSRDGYREGVRSDSRGRTVYLRSDARAPLRERRIEVPADAVIDAGFDAGIRANWERLREEDGLSLPFLLPSRMAFVPVRVSPGPTLQWRGLAAQRMTMRLDRWYGFAAPTMQLTYALEDRRLLEFAGIASIRDASGRHQDVRITFPEPARPADTDALRRALETPLVRQCGG